MKIEYNNGCNYSLTIDGIETCDIPIEEFKNKLKYIIDKLDDAACLQDILKNIAELNGKYECSDEPCEDCGEYNENYTLEI